MKCPWFLRTLSLTGDSEPGITPRRRPQHLYLQRHLISRSTLRTFRAEAMAHWQAVVAEP